MSNKRAGITIILLNIFSLSRQIPKSFTTPSGWDIFWIALYFVNIFLGVQIMKRPCADECEDECEQ